MLSDVPAQAGFDPWPRSQVHVEWGVPGARMAAARGDLVVIVDVLSFSTTLAIGVQRGVTCVVHSGAEIEAMGGHAAAAARYDARPASRDRRVGPGEISLSPASLLTAPVGQRVLLTSLNGAAAVAAAGDAPGVLVGCLRNASACASLVRAHLEGGTADRVTVVACGEQWSSVAPAAEGLRPAIEDWLGAGLLSTHLAGAGLRMSAEAQCAAAAWSQAAPGLIADCVSARELVAAGFADDVALALEVDVQSEVPVRQADGRAFAGSLSAQSGRGIAPG